MRCSVSKAVCLVVLGVAIAVAFWLTLTAARSGEGVPYLWDHGERT